MGFGWRKKSRQNVSTTPFASKPSSALASSFPGHTLAPETLCSLCPPPCRDPAKPCWRNGKQPRESRWVYIDESYLKDMNPNAEDYQWRLNTLNYLHMRQVNLFYKFQLRGKICRIKGRDGRVAQDIILEFMERDPMPFRMDDKSNRGRLLDLMKEFERNGIGYKAGWELNKCVFVDLCEK